MKIVGTLDIEAVVKGRGRGRRVKVGREGKGKEEDWTGLEEATKGVGTWVRLVGKMLVSERQLTGGPGGEGDDGGGRDALPGKKCLGSGRVVRVACSTDQQRPDVLGNQKAKIPVK